MFRPTITRSTRALLLLLSAFIAASNCYAIPTWIGITGSTPRQAGGNPGTFTVMMNQYYATLHASVAISVNGGNWKEYPMSYDGMSAKNSKWSYTPAALFPASASVKYYFRGWDDAGGTISDGSMTASYSLIAVAPAVLPVPADVDVYGSSLSMGSLLEDLNRPLVYMSASDNGATSVVRFSASRVASDWIWERGLASGPGAAAMMKLDALNRVTIFDPAVLGRSAIVLEPGGSQAGISINGDRVLTTGSAATTYLPIHPAQLTVGTGNTAGADSLAVGSLAQATGQNSTALGAAAKASGVNAAAAGDHTVAQGAGQFVTGAFNVPQGTPTTAAPTDQIFAIGNGTDETHRANAVTVLKNGRVGIGTTQPSAKLDVQGDVQVDGKLKITGPISIAPQGDLSMGEFTQGAH